MSDKPSIIIISSRGITIVFVISIVISIIFSCMVIVVVVVFCCCYYYYYYYYHCYCYFKRQEYRPSEWMAQQVCVCVCV